MVREAEERRKIRLKTSLTNLMDFKKEDAFAAKKLIDQLDEIAKKGTVLVCLNCMYVRHDNLDDALCEKCNSLMGEVMPENVGKRVLISTNGQYHESSLRGLFSQDYVLSFVRL